MKSLMINAMQIKSPRFLSATNLSLDYVIIFCDENENGSFEESEDLVTTITSAQDYTLQ